MAVFYSSSAGRLYLEYTNYAALPAPGAATGEIVVVLNSTGLYVVARKEAGLWYSNGVTWVRLGDIPSFFNATNFELFDNVDNTKRVGWDISAVANATKRTITMPDANVDLGLVSANLWQKVATVLSPITAGDSVSIPLLDLKLTVTKALDLNNPTASDVVNTQQNSPYLSLLAQRWETTGGTNQTSEWKIYAEALTGATTGSSSYLKFAHSKGGAADTAPFYLTSGGAAIFGAGGTFSGALTVTRSSISTTSTQGCALNSSSASTVGTPVRYSPYLEMIGKAWNTTGGVDNSISFKQEVRPTSGATTAGTYYWSFDNNGGGYTDIMTLTSLGTLSLPGSYKFTGAGSHYIKHEGGTAVTDKMIFRFSDDEDMMAVTGTGVGIKTLVPYGWLDVCSGLDFAIYAGADVNAVTRTADTDKFVRIVSPSYATSSSVAGTPVALITAYLRAASNTFSFGGGSGSAYAATKIDFYTAANATTSTGTIRMSIDSAGLVTIQRLDIQNVETDGLLLTNTTASLVGTTIQYAPSLRLTSHSWNTTTGSDKQHDWRITNIPASGATASCKAGLYFRTSYDGEAYSSVMYCSYYGLLTTAAGISTGTGAFSSYVDINRAVATTSQQGLSLYETTAADVGTPVRYSPYLSFTGRAWNTTTPASNTINFRMEVIPVSGATTSGALVWSFDNNGGGYSELMRITSAGKLGIGTDAPATNSQVTIKATASYLRLMSNATADNTKTTIDMSCTTAANTVLASFQSDRVNLPYSADHDFVWNLYSNSTLGERMRLKANGYLGIGIAPLDNVHIYSAVTSSYLRIEGSAVDAGIKFEETGSSIDWKLFRDITTNNMHLTQGVDFAETVNSMTWTSDGNIGINTTTPVSELEVRGTSTTQGPILTMSTSDTIIVATNILGRINFVAPLEASGGDALLTAASIVAMASGSFTATDNPCDMIFATAESSSAVERMRLTSAGYLAIGTTTPSGTLHIEGTTGMLSYRFSTSATGGGYILLGHSKNGTVGTLTELVDDDEMGKIIVQAVNSGAWTTSAGLYYYADQDHSAGKIGSRIEFKVTPNDSATAATVMTVLNSGFVGIGLTAPTEMLDVNGNIKATGYKTGTETGVTTTQTVVTDVRDNAGVIEKKTQVLTFTNGLLTTQGAESGWA